MNLAGRIVEFRLSPDARQAMSGLVPDAEILEALVVDEDSLGAWIWIPEREHGTGEPRRLTLLKWEHFSTARLEYQPEAPAERRAPGFRP